ncbi:glycosyltransferase involved in cell wall biosynthesis [Sphingobium sp. B7D2B]|nr:glycosyltransferase involved in cell wall biosynthesis [Sphingobium sp. B7D2B]
MSFTWPVRPDRMVGGLLHYCRSLVGGAPRNCVAPSHGPDGTIRHLLVDVSIIARHDARTGIQRVVRAIWTQLAQAHLHSIEVIPVIGSKRRPYAYAPKDFLESPVDVRKWRGVKVDPHPGDIFLGLDLSSQIIPRRRRQIAQWKRAGLKFHVVVYDLLPWTDPQWFTRRAVRNFRKWLDMISTYADGALCISDHVRREFSRWLQVSRPGRAGHVAISRLAMGSEFDVRRGLPEATAMSSGLLKAMAGAPTLLMVGTVEPRKGYDCALAAFDVLWRRGPQDAPNLMIVGKPGWKTASLQQALLDHPEFGKRLFWARNVSDECLERLYGGCAGLLVASRAEGFGLPVLEALARGCPVLARNLAVFQEQASPGLSYFDDDDATALARSIEAFLNCTSRASSTISGHPVRPGGVFSGWKEACSDILTALDVGPQTVRNEASVSSGLKMPRGS